MRGYDVDEGCVASAYMTEKALDATTKRMILSCVNVTVSDNVAFIGKRLLKKLYYYGFALGYLSWSLSHRDRRRLI